MTSDSGHDRRIVDDDEIRALVALSLVPGIGPGRIRTLMSYFGSARAAFRASRSALECVPGIGAQIGAAIAEFRSDDVVDQQFERADKVGAELITVW